MAKPVNVVTSVKSIKRAVCVTAYRTTTALRLSLEVLVFYLSVHGIVLKFSSVMIRNIQ